MFGGPMTTYNNLVDLEEEVVQARGDVDVLLQRRRDELTRLSVAVREATGHESATLSEVVSAREAMTSPGTPKEVSAGDQHIQRALVELDARTEEYPEVDAISNVEDLQKNIVRIEEELAEQRRSYNEKVKEYNKAIRKFPTSVVARVAGFEERDRFEPSAAVETGDEVETEELPEQSEEPKQTLEPWLDTASALPDADEQDTPHQTGDHQQ